MFKFGLEPVLNHRKTVEDNLQRELSVFKTLLKLEKKKLLSFKRAKMKSWGELQQKQMEGISVSEILLYVGFIERISKNLEKQEETVLEVETKFVQKREDVISAMKDRKTLEKLKEKSLMAYKQKLIKNEQSFLDEVAINRVAGGI